MDWYSCARAVGGGEGNGPGVRSQGALLTLLDERGDDRDLPPCETLRSRQLRSWDSRLTKLVGSVFTDLHDLTVEGLL